MKHSGIATKLSKPTGQKISKVRKQKKKFNSANLILMSIGKSGVKHFEFENKKNSFCQTYPTRQAFLHRQCNVTGPANSSKYVCIRGAGWSSSSLHRESTF